MGVLGSLFARLDTSEAWLLAQQAGVFEGVNPAFVMAVMERESGFDPAARGDAGELGLMQLLPATAAILAGRTVTENDLLTDRALNVQLGARYLAQNIAKYNGSYPDAYAAYNAGSARRNAAGQYVNSIGDTIVQQRVEGVMSAYMRWSGGQQPTYVTTLTATAPAQVRVIMPQRTWSSLLSEPWVWAIGAFVAVGIVAASIRRQA